VDKVVFQIIDDPTDAIPALRSGRIDILGGIPWIDAPDITKTNPDILHRLSVATTSPPIAIKVNASPPDETQVRQALNMAIDRQAYNPPPAIGAITSTYD